MKTREELVNDIAAARRKYTAEYKVLTKKIKLVLDSVIRSTQLGDFTKVGQVTDTCAEISVDRPGKPYGHTFDINYHEYGHTSSAWLQLNKPTITMNVGTFGSFSAGDKSEVNFYVAAGKFASHLGKIQSGIARIDFKPFKDARHVLFDAEDALREFDNAAERAEIEKRNKKIEAKLVPGAKIVIGVDYITTSGGQIIEVENRIIEVEKTTPKRVYFNRYVHCLKKEDVFNNFTRSPHPWKFV